MPKMNQANKWKFAVFGIVILLCASCQPIISLVPPTSTPSSTIFPSRVAFTATLPPMPTSTPRIWLHTSVDLEADHGEERFADRAETSRMNSLDYVAVVTCPNGCTELLPGCEIKGNISVSSGNKIYHLPGQQYYSVTVISPEYGERWFCTEEEAIANGWRKSYR